METDPSDLTIRSPPGRIFTGFVAGVLGIWVGTAIASYKETTPPYPANARYTDIDGDGKEDIVLLYPVADDYVFFQREVEGKPVYRSLTEERAKIAEEVNKSKEEKLNELKAFDEKVKKALGIELSD